MVPCHYSQFRKLGIGQPRFLCLTTHPVHNVLKPVALHVGGRPTDGFIHVVLSGWAPWAKAARC